MANNGMFKLKMLALWEILRQDSDAEHRYYFYFWSLSSQKKLLARITFSDMLSQIPRDQDSGRWESVKVPFAAFNHLFFIVN